MNIITHKNKILIISFLCLFLIFGFALNIFSASSIYQICDISVDCELGEFIFADDSYTPIATDNFCQITITDPAQTIVVPDYNMLDRNDGWYYYTFNASTPEGLYRSKICCDTGANKRCTDKTFVLGTSVQGLPAKIWNYTTRTVTSFGTLVADISTAVWDAATRTLTGKGLAGGESLATESYIDLAVADIVGSNSDMDLTTLAGYVDSVEGYVGLPADNASQLTLFGKIKDVRTKLDQLDTLQTNLATVDGIIDAIRAAQLLGHTLQFSNVGEVLETEDYRAKLTISDYDNNPIDALSTPTITIYDSTRTEIVSAASMTKLSTGVYEYVYTTLSGAVNGTWEAVARADLGGSADVTLNDYFEVEGSPAQVIINSVSDATVPTISANVTISNEGSVGYEYDYEYCVVASETNQCGGGDDIAYASAAKFLNAGQDWTTDLPLTVSSTGDYWFKVVVYWSTETSGASKTFTATEQGTTPPSGGGGYSAVSLYDIYSKLLEVQKEVGYHGEASSNIGQSAFQTLKILSDKLKSIGGTKGYDLDQLYDVSSIGSSDLLYLKNKTLEMNALLEANKMLIDKSANKPIITTWFEWGSVILKMLVVNPSTSQAQTVPFKAYLPRETKPEYIIDKEDLSLDFDDQAQLYYVHKDIELKPGQSVTKKVEIKDVWTIPPEEIDSLRKQFEDLLKPLNNTAFFAQAITLKSDADRLLDSISRKQDEYKASPQDHILAYRDNLESLKAVKVNMDALKTLVAEESGAGRALGGLFGVSTTMTWGIIIIVVIGIAAIMYLLYALLKKRQEFEKNVAPIIQPAVQPPQIPQTPPQIPVQTLPTQASQSAPPQTLPPIKPKDEPIPFQTK